MLPILDNIIVKPFPPDKISSGGIIVPDSVQQRPAKATVVAVGRKVKGIEKGDVVYHVLKAGVDCGCKCGKYIIKQMDVLAIESKN